MAGYWPSPWPGEDAGPARSQTSAAVRGPGFQPGRVAVRSREALAATMVVLRDPGEVFALRHTIGANGVGWVERIDPVSLEARAALR